MSSLQLAGKESREKKSFEPDLNQRPMDIWQCTTTVHRSTNWAIEGEMVRCDQNSGLNMIGWQCPWQLNVSCYLTSMCWYTLSHLWTQLTEGDVAQMVERSLSMWEVGGSIPPVSKKFFSHKLQNNSIQRWDKNFAVGRIRTCAPRGKLISSQSP